MNDYIEVRVDFSPCSEDITDIAAALLADVGFESFVADASGLTAYIKKDLYNPTMSRQLDDMPIATEVTWHAELIEGQDWNSEWEKNYFKPIVVDSRCVIHSSFHTDVPSCTYDIVIDPKMAFGTGHHATTHLMLNAILDLPMSGASVIDMGTGTGILAILASMRGASPVVGIEIDEFAYVNAVENIALNSQPGIELINGDASALGSLNFKAKYLLANINRNVILADMPKYADALADGGMMVLSGFYIRDIEMISEMAKKCGLIFDSAYDFNDWASLRFVKDKSLFPNFC